MAVVVNCGLKHWARLLVELPAKNINALLWRDSWLEAILEACGVHRVRDHPVQFGPDLLVVDRRKKSTGYLIWLAWIGIHLLLGIALVVRFNGQRRPCDSFSCTIVSLLEVGLKRLLQLRYALHGKCYTSSH